MSMTGDFSTAETYADIYIGAYGRIRAIADPAYEPAYTPVEIVERIRAVVDAAEAEIAARNAQRIAGIDRFDNASST